LSDGIMAEVTLAVAALAGLGSFVAPWTH